MEVRIDIYARFGHLLGQECLDLAVAAEALGFDGIVMSDHVFFPAGDHHPYPYSDDGEYPFRPDTPWPDPFVMIGALAAVTERLQFLTAVYLLALRHPLIVAKAIATAAAFSEDRVKLGVGVGWMREEFEVLGVDFATRGARTDEAIDALRALWRGDTGSHQGSFFSYPAVRSEPHPGRPIPILVGGLSDAAVRRAVTRGDGYVGVSVGLDEAAALVADLRRRVEAAGRDPGRFEICITCSEVSTADDLCRLAEAGVDTLYVVPWPDPARSPTSGTKKADALAQHAELLDAFRWRTA